LSRGNEETFCVDETLFYNVHRFCKEETQHWLSPNILPHSEDGEGLHAAAVGRNRETKVHDADALTKLQHNNYTSSMTPDKEVDVVSSLYSFSTLLPDLFTFFDQHSQLKISAENFDVGYKKILFHSGLDCPPQLSESDCDCIFCNL
jgi:hypothetical protein